jgi:hypothetical protein
MPKNTRTQLESTGTLLVHTAEAMMMSSNPERKAAAEVWLKKINRELNKVRSAPKQKAA